jgi:glutamate 5-kinase
MSKTSSINMDKVKRVVIKIGSAVLTNNRGQLATRRLHSLVDDMAQLLDRGVEVIVVSSGAVAAGVGEMGCPRPRQLAEKQALAAVGQGMLMAHYRNTFRRFGRKVAQVLLTRDDMEDRRRYLNAYHTLEHLLQLKVIPIINENDTTTVDELCFTDNDMLAVIVATKMRADLLVLLSDVDGIYDKNPKEFKDAALVPIIHGVTDDHERLSSGMPSAMGRGGMTSKIRSARMASVAGVTTVIANGQRKGVVESVFKGSGPMTMILPQSRSQVKGRRKWIATGGRSGDRIIVIDSGASAALIKHKKSLLPVGVKNVRGEFSAFDVVEIVDSEGQIVAKGIVNYSSAQLSEIKGLKSADVQRALGSDAQPDVIHRDNLVVLVNH